MLQKIAPLLESFTYHCPEISEKELEFLKENIYVSEYEKKKLYLKPNFIQSKIGFIVSGLIRIYCIDKAGKEITLSFVKENEYVCDYLSFVKQIKTKYYFECLENCIVINLPFTTIQEGYRTSKNFEKYGRLIAEKNLEFRINRVDSFLFQNAEERYLSFIKENPNLLHRITLTHLASYLGIERQTLTRIKKKIIKI
jgi:CRP-like cAMP-binding protein